MADKPRNPLSFWSPDHEQQFQTYMAFDPGVRAWRNGFQNRFGEQPRIDGDNTFNYREAYLAGNGPEPYAHDTVPHWKSTGKSKDHPTAWMETFMQQFGVDPNDIPAGSWTPEMQQFMQGQIGRVPTKPRNPLNIR